MKVFLCWVLSFFFFGQALSSQVLKTDSVLIRGMVYDVDSSLMLRKTMILLNKTLLQPTSDGKFNMWVRLGDLLRFSHAGFKDVSVFISDSIWREPSLLGVFLSRDTVKLAEVVVVPRIDRLRNKARLMQVVLMPDAVYATQNIQKSTVVALTTSPSKMDAQMNQQMVMDEHVEAITYKGMVEPGRMVGIGTGQLTQLMNKASQKGQGVAASYSFMTPQEVDYLINLYQQHLIEEGR